ncbi:hypothetical protein FHX08_002074 [Rhizobium sp. BK529]|uniref:hypothetical protein n=1 Tax=Rhizobium sp. BK529 TaxID=2586983 RepID=UPI00160C2ECC|nr:hypothetical protein [Rhizobium sp. BK529]MBB3591730.1 hypothetical protein [Rhizobium sp. BK529]
MTVPVWPATLPQVFLRDGYDAQGADNLIASSVSIGPAKVRRRTTAAVKPLSGSMIMSSTQFQVLVDFIENDIADRAKAFTFPDPHGGAPLLVRMTQPIKEASVGADWRIQIVLEVLP